MLGFKRMCSGYAKSFSRCISREIQRPVYFLDNILTYNIAYFIIYIDIIHYILYKNSTNGVLL